MVGGASNPVPAHPILCLGDFMGLEEAVLEPQLQRKVWLPYGDEQLRAESIQKRHSKALKLNRFRSALLEGIVEVAVDEVQVGRALDYTANRMASSVVFNAERMATSDYANGLRMP